jgi:hypothetical protein
MHERVHAPASMMQLSAQQYICGSYSLRDAACLLMISVNIDSILHTVYNMHDEYSLRQVAVASMR